MEFCFQTLVNTKEDENGPRKTNFGLENKKKFNFTK